MPTYQDALAAEPSEFVAYAAEMTAAASDLATQQAEYGEKVAGINQNWRDTANDAFNGEAGTVAAHLTQVVGEITTAAGSLAAAGSQMLTECTLLRVADAALKAVGFDVQPAPLVTLGAAQRTAIAMAGPFGGLIEAALQAQALAGTLGLQTLTTLVNAADATAGAALSAAADLLKPLDDKTSAGDDDSMNKMAEDHSDGGDDSSEGSEEESEEEKEEEEEQTEEEQEEPGEEDQAGDPSAEQPTTPETPSGMEDLAQPETPDLDNPWDASELADPEDFSGGLAGGGGLGGGAGGLPGGGLSTGGAGVAAGSSVPMGAMGAGGGAALAAGAGSGAGGMMGGGRGGGGGRSEDENARESNLIEDPDEDVWGIGKAADDMYE
ncbi:hypothetical protein [Glycomyces sp. NPDC047010]|uniref:hypothetical protein n=1 Tax=Glycomyces sp. NPDC047010 TaxID=3155023 RepID=UPI0033C101EF